MTAKLYAIEGPDGGIDYTSVDDSEGKAWSRAMFGDWGDEVQESDLERWAKKGYRCVQVEVRRRRDKDQIDEQLTMIEELRKESDRYLGLILKAVKVWGDYIPRPGSEAFNVLREMQALTPEEARDGE